MSLSSLMKIVVCLAVAVAFLFPAAAWAQADGQYTPSKPTNPWIAICTIEVLTGVGAIIWAVRAKKDGWKVSGGPINYCIWYSKFCPHYAWQQGCLRRHAPHCCN